MQGIGGRDGVFTALEGYHECMEGGGAQCIRDIIIVEEHSQGTDDIPHTNPDIPSMQ